MPEATPVIVMGLGEIGQGIVRAVLAEPGLRLVAAVDKAEALVGKPLASLVIGAPGHISASLDAAGRGLPGQRAVLLHATGSHTIKIAGELENAARLGLHVVSTCEELSWPWLRARSEAERLDAMFKKANIAAIGVGVNPGFVLDRLPALLSHVSGPVRRIHARRVVDTRTRRLALQRKTAAGLTAEQFAARKESLGHVGLCESAVLCALGAGLGVTRVSETIEPVIAAADIDALIAVRAGQVAGIHQVARAYDRDTLRVELDLTIALAAPDPCDEVQLDADPPLRLRIDGGTPGERATIATAIAAALHARHLPPGLRSVLELPAAQRPLEAPPLVNLDGGANAPP